MTYATDFELEIRRAEILTAKDHRQRWVYRGPNGATISDSPVPFKDKVSVCWLPIVGAVSVNWSPRLLTHPSIGAL